MLLCLLRLGTWHTLVQCAFAQLEHDPKQTDTCRYCDTLATVAISGFKNGLTPTMNCNASCSMYIGLKNISHHKLAVV